MNITELISQLEVIRTKYGDLKINNDPEDDLARPLSLVGVRKMVKDGEVHMCCTISAFGEWSRMVEVQE